MWDVCVWTQGHTATGHEELTVGCVWTQGHIATGREELNELNVGYVWTQDKELYYTDTGHELLTVGYAQEHTASGHEELNVGCVCVCGHRGKQLLAVKIEYGMCMDIGACIQWL